MIGREPLNSLKWEHYNKLTDLVLSIENTPHENWSEIVANMHRELNAVGDNKINGMMKLFLDVIVEDEHVGIKPSQGAINLILDRTREYVNKKYKRY